MLPACPLPRPRPCSPLPACSIGITEGLSRRLKCMQPGCGVVCEEEQVKQLLRGNKPLLAKYEQALLGGCCRQGVGGTGGTRVLSQAACQMSSPL